MVRAGEGAFLIDRFKNENKVVVGAHIGDLTNVKNPDEIKKMIQNKFPGKKPGQINSWASQISKFRFSFKIGDKVISYDPQNRFYLVGEIISDYIFDDNFFKENPYDYCDVRKIKQIGEVNRDDLTTSTKNSLGAISAIFEINPQATKEILEVLKGKREIIEDENEELDILKEDIISQSLEFIKDKILELGWDDMQDLVAGLIRGMGYKTIVSNKGPDRGRDIIASPDGLGLEEPRIVIEVKHRSGKIGSSDIRSFTGGLRQSDKGLYVSTGGFSIEAKYEAERSNKPLTLVNADLLVNLILQYYDNFDSEAKSIIPLTKIYWPT